jgi:acyl-[acyl-carrier-protein]-phospholipid O-acyltransferase / long-chain-fatty-acid--[acyl-carrier-protein] ligase
MSHAAPKKLRKITILGQQNVPSGGVLIIPSKLGYLDVLQLERILEGRSLMYLVAHGAALSPEVKAHLAQDHVHVQEFSPSASNIEALRKETQDAVKKNSVVIYVPPLALAQNATLTTVPGAKLEFLMQLRVPVVALYVLDTAEVAMAIEPRPPVGDSVFAFGRVIEEPNVAAFQESLLGLAEACFSGKPALDINLAYALLRGLKKHGSKASVIDGKDEQTMRFDKVLAAAIVLAAHVRAATKKPRVGIILPPGILGLIANVAVMLAGKVPVNVNYTAGRAAVDSSIKQAELDHYLTADLFVRKMQTFPWPPNRQLTFIERLLPQKKAAIARWFILSKLLPASALAAMLGIPKKGGNTEALLLFTSGSSGEPKGVVLSHRNLMANVCQFGSRLNLGTGDRILGSLPLFHSFGCTVTLWYPVIQGVSLITYSNPVETKKLAELIHKYQATVMIATPTFLRGYLKGVNPEWLASLKLVVTGAEKLPRTVADTFETRFGKRVLEGYGLTETSPVSNVNLHDLDTAGTPEGTEAVPSHRFGSVGQPLPGVAVRITDPTTDAPLPLHESGMIWFKGANVFEGYLKNAAKTDEVIKDGWFRTGDVGRMDSDGFLFIEGRLSRFSKIGGEMVPHETVEENLVKALNLEGESIRRLAVIGVPDIEKGEALVLLTTIPGGSVQQEILDLRYKMLDRGMPPLWIPKKLVRVAEIPILSSGKLDVKACEKLAKTAGW